MRWPLIVVALLIGVMLWDHFANDSTYTADLERGLRHAASVIPG